jgi:hypothetical protein
MSRTISRIQKNHKEDTCLKEIIIHAWSERRQQNLHFKKASIEMSTMSKISIYELQNSEVNVCSLDLGGLLIILYWSIQFHFINTLREVMLTSKKKTCAYHGTHSPYLILNRTTAKKILTPILRHWMEVCKSITMIDWHNFHGRRRIFQRRKSITKVSYIYLSCFLKSR